MTGLQNEKKYFGQLECHEFPRKQPLKQLKENAEYLKGRKFRGIQFREIGNLKGFAEFIFVIPISIRFVIPLIAQKIEVKNQIQRNLISQLGPKFSKLNPAKVSSFKVLASFESIVSMSPTAILPTQWKFHITERFITGIICLH